MSIGQRVKMVCPPKYGYGKRGFPGVYPLFIARAFMFDTIIDTF